MMNDLAGKTEIVAKAASDKSGSARFFVAHESNRGQSHLLRDGPARRGEHTVETVAVDSVVSERGVLVVAKLDVEGHEDEVIGGMSNTILNNGVVLQIERNNGDIERLEQRLGSLGAARVHSIGPDHYFVKS